MANQWVIEGDCIRGMRALTDASVHCCVTSPPYWGLRDYGHEGQIGLEETPDAYVARMVEVFREVRRVLRDDGTLWLNLGDSYNGIGGPGKQNGGPIGPTAAVAIEGTKGRRISGLKAKDLVGIPWRVAFALQADGWWLRQDIIWHKPNPMPESVRDRCTKAHEYVFLMTKSERYYYDAEAVSEAARRPAGSGNKERKPASARGVPVDTGAGTAGAVAGSVPWQGSSRNKRSVWTVTTRPYKGAHFATMPPALVQPCIQAGTSERGCCPACGAPLQRETRRTKLKRERPNAYTKRHGDDGTGNSCANDVAGVAVETLGWRPSCRCEAGEPVPCTVLDPFAGSGTTLAVAAELGRSAVGCELNPEYVRLAYERIGKARERVPLFC